MNRVRDKSLTLDNNTCIIVDVLEQILKDVFNEEKERKLLNFWDEEV